MSKGNIYVINDFRYVAMNEKIENGESILLLVNISQVSNPSLGKWIAQKLLPPPIAKSKSKYFQEDNC